MSLFIGLMAFPDTPVLQNGVKLGVFLGSIVSASAGLLVLGSATSPHRT
jgi:Na+:H+ antiporter, NhaA family